MNFRQLSSVDIDILAAYVMHFIAPCPRLHSLWKSVMYVDFGYRTFCDPFRRKKYEDISGRKWDVPFRDVNTRTFRNVNGTYNGTAVNVTYIGSIKSLYIGSIYTFYSLIGSNDRLEFKVL